MKTIVFADRSFTLNEARMAAALQPVADKTVIEFTLEELADAGLTDVIVVAAPEVVALRYLLGNGERWGLNLNVVTSRGDEAPGQILPRLGIAPNTTLLVLRGDEIRSRGVEAFLKIRDLAGGIANYATDIQGRILMITSQDFVNPNGLDRSSAVFSAPARSSRVSLPGMQCCVIESAGSLSQANLGMLGGDFSGQLIPGLQYGEHLRRGRLADVDAMQVNAPAYVGDHARLHPTAFISGTTVIGARAFVDEGTELHNCVVMPGTYVGANLVLKDVLITSAGIYQTQLDHHTPIEEPLWVDATVGRSREQALNLTERGLALLAALVSLPLLLLGMLGQVLAGRSTALQFLPLESNQYGRNGQTHMCYLLQVGNPMGRLQKLAKLWLVVGGHRRLLGVTDEEAEVVENWEYSLRRQPKGVISAAAMLLPANAPREEKVMAEILFASQSLAKQLSSIAVARWHRQSPGAQANVPGLV